MLLKALSPLPLRLGLCCSVCVTQGTLLPVLLNRYIEVDPCSSGLMITTPPCRLAHRRPSYPSIACYRLRPYPADYLLLQHHRQHLSVNSNRVISERRAMNLFSRSLRGSLSFSPKGFLAPPAVNKVLVIPSAEAVTICGVRGSVG